jgi:hypothetical protein
MLEFWVLGGSVTGVTPLACHQNLPCPQSCCHLGPFFSNSCCPKPDQISSLRKGVLSVTCIYHRMLTEERICSLAYYYAWSCSETPHISAIYGSTFYIPVSLFLYIRLQLKLLLQVEFTKLSHFQQSCWEKRYINRAASNDLYLLVWQWCAVSSSFLQTILL